MSVRPAPLGCAPASLAPRPPQMTTSATDDATGGAMMTATGRTTAGIGGETGGAMTATAKTDAARKRRSDVPTRTEAERGALDCPQRELEQDTWPEMIWQGCAFVVRRRAGTGANAEPRALPHGLRPARAPTQGAERCVAVQGRSGVGGIAVARSPLGVSAALPPQPCPPPPAHAHLCNLRGEGL